MFLPWYCRSFYGFFGSANGDYYPEHHICSAASFTNVDSVGDLTNLTMLFWYDGFGLLFSIGLTMTWNGSRFLRGAPSWVIHFRPKPLFQSLVNETTILDYDVENPFEVVHLIKKRGHCFRGVDCHF